MPDPKRILLVNQSTTYLFRSLCERLAEHFPGANVALLSGALEAEPEEVLPFSWIRSIQLIRHSSLGRFWTWSVFSLHFLFLVIFRRYDIVLVTTNPPFCPWLMGLINHVFRRPYIIMEYDIYPDVLARMGGLKEASIVYQMLCRLSATSLRRASAVVTLGEDMAGHLRKHCNDFEPDIRLIPNWADTEVYRPLSKAENPFVQEQRLEGKFVVMYSGAFGATHDMESMLKAASLLQDLPEVIFVLIGKGTRYAEIEQAIERQNLPNVRLLPWQPLAMAPLSLAAADCHIVTLDGPYAGISFPSKFYTSISVGAAILALAPTGSDLIEVVYRDKVGISVSPGDAVGMADAIRQMVSNPEETHTMQCQSRKLSKSLYDERQCTQQYADLIKGILKCS
jgi:glycosyltransferase involved in cell wall biosynthesis